ncbi:uncharacterized protein I206_102677 [Kwoniella pini CBS 10737]|uniref:BZIP domain-containing protein n=1 Tax=Kwoniella pini CBS 10737 TaxID=1296096 RepID=A0A1B9I630_9TREE|nr:uncharacterized protein I206_03030 [Kwoniella pini CBS 10737]OCF50968.1 hypothetical protein I206_03030 [Kwoniella pini CBS 10737]
MSPNKEREEFDVDDSGGEEEGHDDHDITGEGGKGSSSSQVRKAQNRIAQREFRLRKQQYIRDLEARVEVLSGDKEERIELMTLLVRNLLKENKDLRGMVKSMAAFVGEGLGSCLPRLGLSADGLDAILNRSDTDTAYEAFVNLKASKEQLEANPGMKFGESRRRASTMKRKRDNNLGEDSGEPEKDKDRGKAIGSVGMNNSKSGSGRSTPLNDANAWTLQPSFYSFQPGEGEDYNYLFPDLDNLLSGTSSLPVPHASSNQQLRPSPRPPLAESGDQFDIRSFPSGSGRSYDDRPGVQGYAQRLMPSSMGGRDSPTGEDQSIPIPITTLPGTSSFGILPGQNMGFYDTSNASEKGSTNGVSTLPFSNINTNSDGGFRSSISITSPDSYATRANASASATGGSSSHNAETPMSSLAGPRPLTTGLKSQGNYARGHPSLLSADHVQSNVIRQPTLREAVAAVTNTDNPLEGPGVTAAELAERRRQQDQLMRIIEEGDPADRKMETMQLITYHLNNFRKNHEYHLPPSLRPTVVQRTIPHEHAIDGIIFPSVRDRMILLRGRYDLVEVFHAMLTEFELHGDDVLDHNSYEISETFIDDYSILIDDSVINISNKWRLQRGLPALKLPDRETDGHPGGGHRIHATS